MEEEKIRGGWNNYGRMEKEKVEEAGHEADVVKEE